MYKRILVPVDGSPASMWGLSEAVKLASQLNAGLKLVHIVDEFLMDAAGAGIAYDPRAVIEALREAGRKTLQASEAYVVAQGLKPEAELIERVGGRAADSIIEAARQYKADLIVMGTHGRRGLRRLAMGSDAEQVVRSAPTPVLLVREETKKS